ncbi:hypothetical protein BASA60_002738 [Batrachochytrium salamandrivorans]|nr:hypothetical protein BASA60_002738 [Batrachochytrium salamandrivorans]
MLSRLIITFLYAAAIGSVSGAFLTFDPDPVFFKDIEKPISFSAKLKSKPTEAVTVYFEHPIYVHIRLCDCLQLQQLDVPRRSLEFCPLFVGSSDPPRQLEFNTELLAKAVTVGPLPAELSPQIP